MKSINLANISLSTIVLFDIVACSSTSFTGSDISLLFDKNQVICPAIYDPICAKELVDGQEVFKNYSNSCEMKARATELLLSSNKGECK